MSISPLPINPAILTWAREESGYPLEKVAKRLQVKEEKLAAWEAGQRQPTLRQLQNLANFLHRPFSVFFLPNPPDLPPLAMEYRRLSRVVPGHESPELRLALRQMLTRRELALNLMAELGDPIPAFDLTAHLHEGPKAAGSRLREAMGIGVDAQLAWANEWQAWSGWRASADRLGVLVFQFAGVPLQEVRGVALPHAPLPVVGVSSKEFPDSRSFTLLHEIVHLMLLNGHEEAPALQETRSPDEWNNVERFAESAASHALIPEAALREQVSQLGLRQASWSFEDVRRLARRFRLTPKATATRLRESGFMDWPRYRQWLAEWDAWVNTLPARKGFATPVDKTLGRAGRPFTRLVLDALAANRITSVDASRYLDLKYQHFEKLRTRLTEGSDSGASVE